MHIYYGEVQGTGCDFELKGFSSYGVSNYRDLTVIMGTQAEMDIVLVVNFYITFDTYIYKI